MMEARRLTVAEDVCREDVIQPLEGELDQIRNIAQVVVSEVFGSGSSTSTSAV